MDYLSWDLAILTRATAYANLSSASAHVGISQPQLSRIVAKLEEQLGLTLLDRESRRKSSWTPSAYRLAEIYTKTLHNFRTEVGALAQGLTPQELRIGTLEGLAPLAIEFCKEVLELTGVMVVHLDVLDTSFLEERFEKNELDLIFTAKSKPPTHYRFTRLIGYQLLEVKSSGALPVFSAFEYASKTHKGPPTTKALVSNSLEARRSFLEKFGGTATLPSPPSPRRTGKKHEVMAMVIAHDSLPVAFWEELSHFIGRAKSHHT